jgi:hypothetical protein
MLGTGTQDTTHAGKLVKVFDIVIAQWSILNSSNARFAGGIPTVSHQHHDLL